MSATQHIMDIVQTINQKGLAGDLDQVRRHLHPNVMFVNTAGAVRVKGRQECMDAFQNFVRHVHASAFRLYNEKVEFEGETAVASYEFDMAYQLAGKDFRKKGREIVVLNRDGENWRVIYRTLSPY